MPPPQHPPTPPSANFSPTSRQPSLHHTLDPRAASLALLAMLLKRRSLARNALLTCQSPGPGLKIDQSFTWETKDPPSKITQLNNIYIKVVLYLLWKGLIFAKIGVIGKQKYRKIAISEANFVQREIWTQLWNNFILMKLTRFHNNEYIGHMQKSNNLLC